MIGSYNLPKTAGYEKRKQEPYLNTSASVYSSYHIENASFISLDYLSLGYNFDIGSKAGFRSLRIYLAGNNLFYITGYSGSDPNPRYEYEDNPLAFLVKIPEEYLVQVQVCFTGCKHRFLIL